MYLIMSIYFYGYIVRGTGLLVVQPKASGPAALEAHDEPAMKTARPVQAWATLETAFLLK